MTEITLDTKKEVDELPLLKKIIYRYLPNFSTKSLNVYTS